MAGLTSTGFQRKTLSEIKTELEADLRAKFGDSIKTIGTSVFGQIIGILSERESSIWQQLEDVYNSQYVDTASGVSLDNAVRYTNITRLEATFSTVTNRFVGTPGTVIPIGFQVNVTGIETDIFETIQAGTIAATGLNEVQTLVFSAVPTSGKFNLNFEGEVTADINFDDGTAEIEAALEALTGIDAVSVTGSFVAGFAIEFQGTLAEQDVASLTVVSNTLSDGASVTVTVEETQKGWPPFVDIQMRALNAGPVQALSGTLTEIISALAGLDSTTNILDAELGQARETDGELRARQQVQQQRIGSPSVEGIRLALLEVEDVEQAIIVENTSDLPDGDGRPPKSFESYVQGGLALPIAETIWEAKAAGIEAHGTITQTIVDSQGFSHDIKFSRPISVPIYMIVNITQNLDELEGALYPANGDDLVRDALLSYFDGLRIGQDVVVNRLYTPINTVPGIIGIEILLGTAPSPTLSVNIPIDVTELAGLESANLTINS